MPKNLPQKIQMCLWFISIMNMDFRMYLNKHSWNTHFCSAITNQDGSPKVSDFSYHSFSASRVIFSSVFWWTFVERIANYHILCKVTDVFSWNISFALFWKILHDIVTHSRPCMSEYFVAKQNIHFCHSSTPPYT